MSSTKQRVMLSRSRGARWEKKGLRGFLEYRDLGVAQVTDGRFGATIARAFAPQQDGEAAPLHVHTLGFHLIFVLKGWLKTEFEGIGEVTLQEGDCISYEGEVIQAHREYSADYEVLQVTMPAEFPTKPADYQRQSGGQNEAR
jgi:quercetin dioxygenase-like cupin family protein